MKQESHTDMDATYEKRQRAQKRVEEIKGFYSHLAVYILVNLVILAWSALTFREIGEPLFQWPMLITPAAWGVGLAFHYAKTFHINPFFGKDWEERQIRKYMKEDEQQANRFSRAGTHHSQGIHVDRAIPTLVEVGKSGLAAGLDLGQSLRIRCCGRARRRQQNLSLRV